MCSHVFHDDDDDDDDGDDKVDDHNDGVLVRVPCAGVGARAVCVSMLQIISLYITISALL